MSTAMHETPFSYGKCETTYEQQAFAALAVAESVVLYQMCYPGMDYDCREWLEMISGQSCIDYNSIISQLSKFNGTMAYYANSGASSCWKQETFDVIKCTHSVHVQKLKDAPHMKKRIQSNTMYKCQMCGRHETNCEYVVHLAGAATKGFAMGNYNAQQWKDADLYRLGYLWRNFLDGYDVALHSSSIHDRDADRLYSGIMVPGKTCLYRLMLTIKAQNMLMEVFFETHQEIAELYKVWLLEESTNETQFVKCIRPMFTFSHAHVKSLGQSIELLHTAQVKNERPNVEEDDTFWTSVLSRFGHVANVGEDNTSVQFLSKAYERMNSVLNAFKHKIVERSPRQSDDDGSQEDEAGDQDDDISEEEKHEACHSRPQRSCVRRRSVILCDDDDDEEEDQEEDEEEDQEEDQEEAAKRTLKEMPAEDQERDQVEDEAGDVSAEELEQDVCNSRPQRSCVRKRSIISCDDYDEEDEKMDNNHDKEYNSDDDDSHALSNPPKSHVPNKQSTKRKHTFAESSSSTSRTGSSESHQTRLIESASCATSASTARGLRIHPDNALHSRKETLDDVVRISSTIYDLNERADALCLASVMARALCMHEHRVIPNSCSIQMKKLDAATALATRLVGVFGSRNDLQKAAIFAAAVVTFIEIKSLWDT